MKGNVSNAYINTYWIVPVLIVNWYWLFC